MGGQGDGSGVLLLSGTGANTLCAQARACSRAQHRALRPQVCHNCCTLLWEASCEQYMNQGARLRSSTPLFTKTHGGLDLALRPQSANPWPIASIKSSKGPRVGRFN